MKQLFLSLILLTGLAFADIIDNRMQDDFPVLIPSVQKLKKTNARFQLKQELTVNAPADMDLSLLEKTLAKRGIRLVRKSKGQCQFLIAKKELPANPESYTLSIQSKSITIKAWNTQGLFNGMQTLRNILRNTPDSALRGCDITDFPDLQIRGVFIEFNNISPKSVDKLCQAMEIYSLFKYNTLLFDFASNFPLKNNPYTKRPKTISMSDLNKLVQAAKANRLEIIPYVQCFSHAYWMTFHPQYEELIGEVNKGNYWNSSICFSKPLGLQLTLEYINEVIDVLHPRYFHLALDELNAANYKACPNCSKKDLTQLFGENIQKITDLVLSKGVTPMFYHDRFSPQNPFFADSAVANALKYIDKRAIVTIWDYSVNPFENDTRFFQEKGYKVCHMSYSDRLENVGNLPMLAARTGSLGCYLTWWLTLRPTFELLSSARTNAVASVALASEKHWFAKNPTPLYEFKYDPTYELKRLSEPENILDFSQEKATAIPLPFNVCLKDNPLFPQFDKAGLAKLNRELAQTPEAYQLTTREDAYYGLILSGNDKDRFPKGTVTIPVNAKLTGLSFLTMASIWNEYLFGLNDKPFLGTLQIIYADGSSDALRLFYRNNINSWNAETSGYGTRFINRSWDKNNQLASFFTLEWKNKFPDKGIKELRFSLKENSGVSTGLFALSALNAQPAVSVKQTIPALQPLSYPAATNLTPIIDFSQGFKGKVNFGATTSANFISPVTYEAVQTPEGWMLKATIPPLKEGKGHGRFSCDIPLNGAKDFKSFVFKIKVSDPSCIRRPDTYILNLRAGGESPLMNFIRTPFVDNFYTFAIPLSAYNFKGAHCADLSKPSHYRIAFFLENRKPITIWLSNLMISQEELPFQNTLRK